MDSLKHVFAGANHEAAYALNDTNAFNKIKKKLYLYYLVLNVHSTAHQTLWTLYRLYFKDISANIALQVYHVTCC
jgi:hypothetical protein